jgi:hypothetical protein
LIQRIKIIERNKHTHQYFGIEKQQKQEISFWIVQTMSDVEEVSDADDGISFLDSAEMSPKSTVPTTHSINDDGDDVDDDDDDDDESVMTITNKPMAATPSPTLSPTPMRATTTTTTTTSTTNTPSLSVNKPIMSTLRIVSPGDSMEGERATQFASTRGATLYRVGFCSVREFKLRGVDYAVQCDVADSGTGPYFQLTLGDDVFKGRTPTAAVRALCDHLGIELIRPVAQFIGLNKYGPQIPTGATGGAASAKRARVASELDAIASSAPRSRRRAAITARKTTLMLLGERGEVSELAGDDDVLDEGAADASGVDGDVDSVADEELPKMSSERRRRIAVIDDDEDADEEGEPDAAAAAEATPVDGAQSPSHVGSPMMRDDGEEDFGASASSRRGARRATSARAKKMRAAAAAETAADHGGDHSGGGGGGGAGGGGVEEEAFDVAAQSHARSDGGLRSFASLVTRYVHSKAATTFADVADAVVGMVQTPDATVNEHNARRRVYDVLNVLQSVGILRKEKKNVTWIGIDELQLGEPGKGDFVPEPIVRRAPPAASAAQPSARAMAAAAAAAAAAAVAAEATALAKRKQEVRERIAAKERRIEQLYNYRIRLQNVINRNLAIERACALVGATVDVERLRVPFLLVRTAATAVVDCDVTADHSEIVLRLSHAFTVADDSVTLEAMHDKGLILRA